MTPYSRPTDVRAAAELPRRDHPRGREDDGRRFGELDLATAGDFEATLREQLLEGPVLLDLSELSFMDSSGVHALDRILSELDRERWTLLVRATLRDNVRQILALTGIHDVIPFEPEPPAQ